MKRRSFIQACVGFFGALGLTKVAKAEPADVPLKTIRGRFLFDGQGISPDFDEDSYVPTYLGIDRTHAPRHWDLKGPFHWNADVGAYTAKTKIITESEAREGWMTVPTRLKL